MQRQLLQWGGTNEAATRVDCLKTLHLPTDLLQSAVNLQHRCGRKMAVWPTDEVLHTAFRMMSSALNRPDCSQLPCSISPLMHGFHYCCCCSWGSELRLVFNETPLTDHYILQVDGVLIFIGYLCLCGYFYSGN